MSPGYKGHFLASLLVASIAVYLITNESGDTIILPDPASIEDVKQIKVITSEMVQNNVAVTGGESIVEFNGNLVTGTVDGSLVWFNPQNLSVTKSRKCPPNSRGTPCRILGLRCVNDSALFGVDEHGRLFQFQDDHFIWLIDENSIELQNHAEPGLFNDLVVHNNMIYITDSFIKHQTLHPLQRFFSFENSGRIIGYNLENSKITIVADDLYLPNGIELSHDNSFLLVSECSMFRILRVDLGTSKVSTFLAHTFGAIDNIRRSKDKGFWLGVSATRFTTSSVPDILAAWPRFRHILTNKIMLPPLLISDYYLGSGAAFYKINSQGQTEILVRDTNKVTKSIALSEVHEMSMDQQTGITHIFVGTPFSTGVFKFEI